MTQPSGNEFSQVSTRSVELLSLSGLVILSIALWWQPLSWTFKLALSSDAHTHILLIPALSIALICLGARRTPARSALASSAIGGPLGWILLTAALSVRALTAWDIGYLSSGNNLSLSIFALVVWWIGSVVLVFGIPTFRSLLFPICFLFLMVPLPDRVLDSVTGFLQHESAASAEILFRAARAPVTRNDTVLSIPGLDLEVAPECSSIRSSTMLIIVTLVLGHLFLRSAWRQVVLVLVAIPLSVLKNAVRIFIIAELTTRVDPAYLHGNLHRQGGIFFLAFALVLEILLLWILRKGES